MGDSALLVGANVIATIATSLVAVVVARGLDPGGWALFSALLGLALGVGFIVDFGLSTWLLRELTRVDTGRRADREGDTARLLSNGLACNVGLTVLVVGVAAPIAVLLGASSEELLVLGLFVLYIGMLAAAGACEARLRAVRRVGVVSSAMLVEKAVLLASLLLVATTSELTVVAAAAAYPLAGATRLCIAGWAAWRGLHPVLPTLGAVRHVAVSSLPFALSAGALNLVPRLDTLVVIGASATSAAYIALGERILGPALFIPVVLSATLYPFVAEARSQRTMWRLTAAVGTVGALVAALAVVVAPFAVPLVFGEPYRDAVGTVQVLMLTLPFVYASNVLLTFLYSAGLERRVLVSTLAVAVAGTAAILVGQMLGGAELAAAGSVVRQACFLAVLVAIGRRVVSSPRGAARDPMTTETVEGVTS